MLCQGGQRIAQRASQASARSGGGGGELGAGDASPGLGRQSLLKTPITKVGSTKIRFTSLEYISHNSWEAAYASPELYEWLAKQTTSQNKVPK